MFVFIKKILDWSEAWALLIPLIFLLRYRKQPYYLTPIIIYLGLALGLNFMIVIGDVYEDKVPKWLHPNNYLYNIHSIVRYSCFTLFFLKLNHPYGKIIKKILPFVSILVLINFIFLESFVKENSFSSTLLSAEAGLLLYYCLQYYLFKFRDDSFEMKKQPEFWVVTGLSIYVVFNFPYFLLYTYLVNKKDNDLTNFVMQMWYYHNLTFIILCIFIAKAFYISNNE